MIRAEIDAKGKSEAVQQITELVKAEKCFCEVTNPQGSCCLGNVSKVVKASASGISSAPVKQVKSGIPRIRARLLFQSVMRIMWAER